MGIKVILSKKVKNSFIKGYHLMSLPSTDWFGSACRCCRHYCLEGRTGLVPPVAVAVTTVPRGGQCSLLGVEEGDWSVCRFAVPPFAPSWERMEGLGMTLAPVDALGAVAGKPHRGV
jgi:hypothetical protein